MAITQPWNIVFFVGFIIYVWTRGYFVRYTRDNEIVERRVDLGEKIMLGSVVITGLLLPIVYLFTPLLSFADYDLPEWAHWCGLVVMIVALWLFWRSHVDLGLNWSSTLELRSGHEIVQQGVYKRIRHPMYAAIWLFCLAQGLLLDNWLAGWGVLLAFGCLYFVRTPREEQMMRERFGEQYVIYMANTGRLLPRLTPASISEDQG
ncbi:MAG: protein-S-isoprenylcysteine O-methyltransferase [Pirellulaceae bacterium]